MTDKANYPNPFQGKTLPQNCLRVSGTIEGPCTTRNDIERVDISEGWRGLPMRVALQVVDSACRPLPHVVVKIWHTNWEGIYSGQTPNPARCLFGNPYQQLNFFRGTQITNENGEVFFDTCFPGWYVQRVPHIHFQVKDVKANNNSNARPRSYRISQLFFPEDISREIYAQHPEYREHGPADTSFATDSVLRRVRADRRHLLIADIQRLNDGAMLVSKTISVV